MKFDKLRQDHLWATTVSFQEGGVVSEVREKVQSARSHRAGVRSTKVSARPRRAEVQDTKTKTRPGAPGQK